MRGSPSGAPMRRTLNKRYSLDPQPVPLLDTAGEDEKGEYVVAEISEGLSKKYYLDKLHVYEDMVYLIRHIQTDWNDNEERVKWSLALSLFMAIQFIVLTVQIVGVMMGISGTGDWLRREDGSMHRAKYYFLTSLQTGCVVMQLVCILNWYLCRVKNLKSFDRIWSGITLLGHPELRLYCATEMLVLALHEPPGFIEFYDNAWKLQILALLRVYTVFTTIRGRAALASLRARMLCALFRVTNNKSFQVRVWMHTYPRQFMLGVCSIGWAVLSVAVYLAEGGDLTFEESMWLTFITMTTVGYGDFSPKTRAGRCIAVLTTVHGLLSTSLLINAVDSALTLSHSQGKIVEFMTEAKMSRCKEEEALNIIGLVIGMYIDRKRSGAAEFCPTYSQKLVLACERFRRARRALTRFVAGVHNEVELPDLADQLRKIDYKLDALSGHGYVGSTMSRPQGSRTFTEPFSPGPAPAPAEALTQRVEHLSTQVLALQHAVTTLAKRHAPKKPAAKKQVVVTNKQPAPKKPPAAANTAPDTYS
eukprot:TRINITY_DN13439_c0_g1_i1.p1 TRINITY_DN13439_c0_g1~~TRINITY_DN13439_c0_g1_i1.p1  ORF type:complete len:532 (+),score=177.75 TRINITY_DN13439_c0_g1_i1:56-1651(+)